MKTRTVPGFLGPTGRQVHVWCRGCCGWHIHGCAGNYGKPGDDLRGRASHCAVDRDGYDIRVSKIPYEVIRPLMYRATLSQREVIKAGRTTAAIERLRAQDIAVMEHGALTTARCPKCGKTFEDCTCNG